MDGSAQNPLGKPAAFAETYTPSLLFPMGRRESREAMGLVDSLPFTGEDVWTVYELSWLDPQGKPQVAGARIRVPCTSPCLVESKSMKLYLNSFSQSVFRDRAQVQSTLQRDLGEGFGAPVSVEVLDIAELIVPVNRFEGESLDQLNVQITAYERDPDLLEVAAAGSPRVQQTVHTDLFRSVCPVTGQPDWATVLVRYEGRAIAPESLLKYLVSYRCHAAFHETTVEQIFIDLKARCEPEQLTVHGRFLRRGGIDISPFRSDVETTAPLLRLPRQ